MSYSLPISLIRQYCFCPRIPYFQELLKLNPKRPQWVKQGEELHQKQQKVFKHRTLKRFNLEHAIQTFDEFVTSDSFALHGVVDSFLNDEENIYSGDKGFISFLTILF
jgi:CRISPR-associated exonuclease Cas4